MNIIAYKINGIYYTTLSAGFNVKFTSTTYIGTLYISTSTYLQKVTSKLESGVNGYCCASKNRMFTFL